jgi:type IV pilus assembly protein PilW
MTTYRTTRPSLARREQGLTLIEMMVAMVLGLVLTGAAVQMFVANRAAYSFNEGLQRLQENGRYALDTLTYNVRMAGSLGCMSAVPIVNNMNSATTLAFNFTQGVTGYEAAGTAPADAQFTSASDNPANSSTAAHWTPALIAPVLTNAIQGSDVLVVRTVNPTAHALTGAFNDGTNVWAVASAADYASGDIAIVADCQKASVFQITTVVEAVVGGVTQVTLSHAAAGTPGNALSTWGTDQTYGLGAQLARAETLIYYVGASAAGPPALFQMRLQTTGASASAMVAEELVEGVDTMQVMYGVDTDLDGDVDAYQTANAVANWATVVTVRIGLLMRSPEAAAGDQDSTVYIVNGTDIDPNGASATDRRVRQVFTATTAIRNRLP